MALVFAAGCGGGGESSPSPPRSAIDPTVAEQLAATSDSIADSLDGDDVCHAAGLADDLNSQVNAAIAAGKVPRRFQDDLRARATELVNTVNCSVPAPTTTQEDNGDEDGNGEGKKKGKKKDKDWTCSASLKFEDGKLVSVNFAHKDVRSPYEWQAEKDPIKQEAKRKEVMPTCTFSLPRCTR